MIWLNGAFHDAEAAQLDISDRGFLLGDGIFETLRATGALVWHFGRHLARMRKGARALDIPVGATDQAIAAAIAPLCTALPDAAIRITLTRGPAPRGLALPDAANPTLLITAGENTAPRHPARLIVAAITRRNEHSPLAAIKSCNYLDSILARREALAAGADDAILLNTSGRIAESCAGTLFLRRGTSWFTPPVTDGALPGIARALILEAGVAEERSLAPADLQDATAALISNSLCLRPICHLSGRNLPLPDLACFEDATRPK